MMRCENTKAKVAEFSYFRHSTIVIIKRQGKLNIKLHIKSCSKHNLLTAQTHGDEMIFTPKGRLLVDIHNDIPPAERLRWFSKC